MDMGRAFVTEFYHWCLKNYKHSDHESIVIVISPLIALMKDQVNLFTSKELKAVKAKGCTKDKYEDIVAGNCHLVFISPEAILSYYKWRKLLLTATASDATIKHIIRDTGMSNPMMVQVSPNKRSVCFGVRNIISLEDCFIPLAEKLEEHVQRLAFKRTIIFCQRQLDCGVQYSLFQKYMGEAISDPVKVSLSFPEHQLVMCILKVKNT